MQVLKAVRIAAVALAAACAVMSPAAAQPTAAGAAPAGSDGRSSPPAAVSSQPPQTGRLAGASVYVYSFLDVREKEFSPEVVQQIDRQLEAALTTSGVTSKVLHFADSIPGSSFAQVTTVPTYGQSRSTEQIPVGPTIASNLQEEHAFGARYRLIEFPADFETMGAWKYFKIHWMLFDCATGARLWNYTYSGRNLIMLYNGERAESRAKTIVDMAIAQLKSGGLL